VDCLLEAPVEDCPSWGENSDEGAFIVADGSEIRSEELSGLANDVVY